MRRLALALLGALAVAAPAAAMDAGSMAQGPHVSVTYDAFVPQQIDVLAGDTVTWSDDSTRKHTVTADDGTWGSPTLVPGDHFDRRFDATGSFAYHCTLHPFMRGEVDVHRVLLAAPPAPAAPGRPYPLAGRAAVAPGDTVTVEGDAGDGAGFQPAGSATVGADGTFTASVTPRTTTTYRAVADGEAGPPVRLLVIDRALHASQARHGLRVTFAAAVAPASPGTTVVLQLRLRDRFGWWPVARARLDRASQAHFALRLRHAVAARVVLVLPDGWTPLVTSPTMHVAAGPRR